MASCIRGGGTRRRLYTRGTPQRTMGGTRINMTRCRAPCARRGEVRVFARNDDKNENDGGAEEERRPPRQRRASSSSSSSSSLSSSSDHSEFFEVVYKNPPEQRSLGMHAAPKNTCCGETVSVNDEVYVVSRVVIRYKLRHGRYRQYESQLDVRSPSRYVVDTYFNSLLRKKRDTDTEV